MQFQIARTFLVLLKNPRYMAGRVKAGISFPTSLIARQIFLENQFQYMKTLPVVYYISIEILVLNYWLMYASSLQKYNCAIGYLQIKSISNRITYLFMMESKTP